jgi:hypothetical protein
MRQTAAIRRGETAPSATTTALALISSTDIGHGAARSGSNYAHQDSSSTRRRHSINGRNFRRQPAISRETVRDTQQVLRQ